MARKLEITEILYTRVPKDISVRLNEEAERTDFSIPEVTRVKLGGRAVSERENPAR